MKKLLMAILLSAPVIVNSHTIVQNAAYDLPVSIGGNTATVMLLDGFDSTLGTVTSVDISITSGIELTGTLPESFLATQAGPIPRPYNYSITVANDFGLGFIPEHIVIFEGGSTGGTVRIPFTAVSTSTMSMTFDTLSDLSGLAAVTTNSLLIPPAGATAIELEPNFAQQQRADFDSAVPGLPIILSPQISTLAISAGALGIIQGVVRLTATITVTYHFDDIAEVHCDAGDSLQSVIDALHPNGGTINVFGNCVNDLVEGSYQPFRINGFTGPLTIGSGNPNNPTISQPAPSCDDANPFPTPSPILEIIDSTNVTISGPVLSMLTISGGEGIDVVNSDVTIGSFVEVRDSHRDGIQVSDGGDLLLGSTNTGPQIFNNCRHGIRAVSRSSATISGQGVVRNNNGFGMVGLDNSTLVTKENAVVSDNAWGGITGRLGSTVVVTGGTIIFGNGFDTTTSNIVFPRFRAGVNVYSGSNFLVFKTAFGVPDISNNTGRGVFVSLASIGRLLGVTVENNTGQGFAVTKNSTVEILPETAQNVFQNNGKKDVRCDNTSVVFGDISAAGTVNCKIAGGL